MKTILKLGLHVVYFLLDGERIEHNNGAKIAVATVVRRPWSRGNTTAQLKVHTDHPEDGWVSSCLRATSLADAMQGKRYATFEECEAWGIDFEDDQQDLHQLLESKVADGSVKPIISDVDEHGASPNDGVKENLEISGEKAE